MAWWCVHTERHGRYVGESYGCLAMPLALLGYPILAAVWLGFWLMVIAWPLYLIHGWTRWLAWSGYLVILFLIASIWMYRYHTRRAEQSGLDGKPEHRQRRPPPTPHKPGQSPRDWSPPRGIE
jgi:hypothetical protein